jgi:hypothetical protein
MIEVNIMLVFILFYFIVDGTMLTKILICGCFLTKTHWNKLYWLVSYFENDSQAREKWVYS